MLNLIKNCQTILSQHFHQCCPSVCHCLLSFYLVRMALLCSLHHSTISNTWSPCANSVSKHVISHPMEAQMMSTVIWAIVKPFFKFVSCVCCSVHLNNCHTSFFLGCKLLFMATLDMRWPMPDHTQSMVLVYV